MRLINRMAACITQLAQSDLQMASRFVAGGESNQVGVLEGRFWACSANQGYFRHVPSQI
jgi:hypothetical protein